MSVKGKLFEESVGNLVKGNMGFIWGILLIGIIPDIMVSKLNLPEQPYITSTLTLLTMVLSQIIWVMGQRALVARQHTTGIKLRNINLFSPKEGLLKLVFKLLGVYVVQTILIVMSVLPFIYMLFNMEGNEGVDMLIVYGLLALLLCLTVTLTLFTPVSYLLMYEPDKGLGYILTKGISLGFKHFFPLLLLNLKIFGMMFLGVITLTVGLIYFVPYSILLTQKTMYNLIGSKVDGVDESVNTGGIV